MPLAASSVVSLPHGRSLHRVRRFLQVLSTSRAPAYPEPNAHDVSPFPASGPRTGPLRSGLRLQRFRGDEPGRLVSSATTCTNFSACRSHSTEQRTGWPPGSVAAPEGSVPRPLGCLVLANLDHLPLRIRSRPRRAVHIRSGSGVRGALLLLPSNEALFAPRGVEHCARRRRSVSIRRPARPSTLTPKDARFRSSEAPALSEPHSPPNQPRPPKGPRLRPWRAALVEQPLARISSLCAAPPRSNPKVRSARLGPPASPRGPDRSPEHEVEPSTRRLEPPSPARKLAPAAVGAEPRPPCLCGHES